MPSLMGKVASTVRSSQPFNSCVRDRAAISTSASPAGNGHYWVGGRSFPNKSGRKWEKVGKTSGKRGENSWKLGKGWENVGL